MKIIEYNLHQKSQIRINSGLVIKYNYIFGPIFLT